MVKYNYEVIGLRVVAHILDNIIELLVFGLVFAVIGFLSMFILSAAHGFKDLTTPEYLIVLYMVAVGILSFVGVMVFNSVYLVKNKGASIGKLIMGLSIIDEKGNNISYGSALGRLIIKDIFFLFSIFGILIYFIIMLKSNKKQSPADMVAQCYVAQK